MKAAVLHVNTARADSVSPTMRIARFVSEQLACPLIHDVDTAKRYAGTRFEVLFVKYGVLKFSAHREEALRIYERAEMVVNLENDRLFKTDVRFRRMDEGRKLETWGTLEDCTQYVNWNILTWQPPHAWATPAPLPVPTQDGLLYYGAFKQERAVELQRFLSDAPYPVTVSTYRGGKKFRTLLGNAPHIIGAFRHPANVADWPMTLYVEDEYSHKLFSSLANRFYECLQLGVAQAIAESALGTFERAGMPSAHRFAVATQRDLAKMLRVAAYVRKEQRRLWHANYARTLHNQLIRASVYSLGEL